MPETALEIETGWELERFDLGTVCIGSREYTVLTGFEGTGRCFWCGDELKGKLRRYCYGHMQEYYKHFEWSSARVWCIERQEGRCANCGKSYADYSMHPSWWTGLEVHHIVPLNGSPRYFSAFNLPWNLIGFCHDCHMEVHAVMRAEKRQPKDIDIFELALSRGQPTLPMLFS